MSQEISENTEDIREQNVPDIFSLVLLNPSELNNNYFDSLENVVDDDIINSTDDLCINTTNTQNQAENKADKEEPSKLSVHARRGRPRSKPLTARIIKERRNVSLKLLFLG